MSRFLSASSKIDWFPDYEMTHSKTFKFKNRNRKMFSNGMRLFKWNQGVDMEQFENKNLIHQKKGRNCVRTLLFDSAPEALFSTISSSLDTSAISCPRICTETSISCVEIGTLAASCLACVLHTVRVAFQCNAVSLKPCEFQKGTGQKCRLGCYPMRLPCRKVRLSHSPR